MQATMETPYPQKREQQKKTFHLIQTRTGTLHAPPPPLLLHIHAPIPTRTHARHERLPRRLRLILDILPVNAAALTPDEHDKRGANEEGQTEEDDVDGDGVVVKDLVGCGVEGRLGEVEEAGETDDEAVDFAEGGEAEDFGGVVAVLIC